MKSQIKVICVILCCIFSSILTGNAQSVYRAGFASVSIEPPKYPFSLALAGYGFPREGRFSLDWIKQGTTINCKTLTGNADYLFMIERAKVMVAKTGTKLIWKSLGDAPNIKLLAAGKKKIYAVDDQGDVLSSAYSGQLNWKKIGLVENAIAITVLDDFIYVADKNGTVRYADVKAKMLNWIKLTELSGISSLTGYADDLHALMESGDIMKLNLKKKGLKWLKIAGYNGVSYDVHLKFIAVANHTLYGLDKDNAIFAGKHLTTGDLSATAFTVSSGKQTLAIIGVDLCGLGYDFVSSVKKDIARKYQIPAHAVMINSSHTHFAPVAQHWPAWPEFDQQPDSIYLNMVVRQAIVLAVGKAIKNRAPSELYFGRGKTAIGENRVLSGDDAPYDSDVDVITAIRNEDHKKTVLFLTGCHAVFKNEGAESYTISANFPGITRTALQSNPDILNAMFIQGCGGDINPVDGSHKNTGEALALDVMTVLNRPMEKLTGAINFHLDSINFPVKKWTEEQIISFRKENDNDKKDVYAEKNVRWADYMLGLSSANKIPNSMPVYIQTFNVGNWKLVGLSREAVTDYSLGIKKIWPGKLVSVAGYCNDVSSYLPTSKHIKLGTYEGLDSFFWYAQPAVFPESVYDTVVNEIKNQNR